MSILKKLNLVEDVSAASLSPAERARASFAARVVEQIEIANATKAGKDFSRSLKKRVKDETTGKTSTVTITKEVRPWFTQLGPKWFVTLRAGAQRLKIDGNKSTIEAGANIDGVIATLAVVQEAVAKGELDKQLLAVARKPKAKKTK